MGNTLPNFLPGIAILALPLYVIWGLHATVTYGGISAEWFVLPLDRRIAKPKHQT